MAPDVIAGNMKFCDFGISHYFNAPFIYQLWIGHVHYAEYKWLFYSINI